MIFGILDVQAGTFTFARAGHNPLILQRKRGSDATSTKPEFAQPRGLGIGMVKGDRFDARIEEQTLDLTNGDTVVLYTDGFSEAMNPARVLYGDDRLALLGSRIGRADGRRDCQRAGDGCAALRRIGAAARRHDDCRSQTASNRAGRRRDKSAGVIPFPPERSGGSGNQIGSRLLL